MKLLGKTFSPMRADISRIFKNTGWLAVQNVAARALGVITTVFLARHLGPLGYGTLATVVSYAAVVGSLSDAGLSGYTTREVSASVARAAHWFGQGLILRLLLSFLALLAALGIGLAMGARASLSLVAFVGAGVILSQLASYVSSFAVALEHMEVLAAGEILYRFALLASCAIALFGGFELIGVGVGYFVAGLLYVFATIALMVPRLFRPTWTIEREDIKRSLIAAFPYFCAGYLAMVYLNLGILLTARLAGAKQAGYFNSAYAIAMAVRIVPGLLLQAVFPAMVRGMAAGSSSAASWYSQTQRCAMVAIMPIAAGGAVLAHEIIFSAYGPSYSSAVPVLSILMGGCWIMTLINAMGYTFVSANRIVTSVKISLAGLVLQAALAVWWMLAYRNGALSTACAMLTSDLFTLVVLGIYARRSMGLAFPWKTLLRSAAAALTMAWSVWMLKQVVPWILAIPIGAVIYVILLSLFHELDAEERRLFSKVFPWFGGTKSGLGALTEEPRPIASSYGVSIIIPSHEGKALLERCLPALMDAVQEETLPVEVILVDDGSSDGTVEWLRNRYPSIRVIGRDRREGFRAAVTHGYEAARHDFIYFLNNDVEVRRGFLAPLLRHFASKDVFAVASKAVDLATPPERAASMPDQFPRVRFRMGFWWHRYQKINPPLNHAVPILFVTMGNGMFRREMMDQLEFLDPRFDPFYFEDQDLCLRAWRRGWRCLYEPASVVAARHQGTIGRLYPRWRIEIFHWRNRFLMQWKNLTGWSYRVRELLWLPALAAVAPLTGRWTFSAGLASAVVAELRLAGRKLRGNSRQITLNGDVPPKAILKAFRQAPKERYRILFLHDYAILGGAERSISLLAAGLDRRRFESIIALAQSGSLDSQVDESGVRLVHLEFPRLHSYRLDRWLRYSWDLARWMRHEKIDLVHGNTPRSNLYAWLAGKLAGIPVVWHMRNVLEPGMTDIERSMRRLPDCIICNARSVSSRFAPDASTDRVRVIYTGVDTERFRPVTAAERIAARSEYGIDREIAVGIAGRIGAKQGHEEFLRAAKIVRQAKPQCRFYILGGAQHPEDQRWEAAARDLTRKLGIEAVVDFLGHRMEVTRFMAAMDILVFPSRFEAFSRAVIEAMACGKAIVATSVGGMLEAVTDGETGRLVPPMDPGRLAAAIIELADDEDKRRRWGQAALDRVRQLFAIENTVRQTEDVYRSLLEGAPMDYDDRN